jgi:myo-inositol-1(or 4)-monophosphatase
VRELKDLVDVARRAAATAAALLRRLTPAAAADWVEKGRHDFVTEADRRAEALISDALTRDVPGSTVVGEELSPAATRAGAIVWIVDPLDGTTNFLHTYPQYAVSIGALVDGVLRVGVIHDVVRDVAYWGASGHGAWSGAGDEARRIHVSGLTEPRHALVGTGFPFKDLPVLRRYLDQFAAVMGATSGIRRAGAAALDLADVAAGRLDCFWELTLAPWDVAAGVLLVREAGGTVTTLEGSPDVVQHGAVVAGNPVLHKWLMDLLRSA